MTRSIAEFITDARAHLADRQRESGGVAQADRDAVVALMEQDHPGASWDGEEQAIRVRMERIALGFEDDDTSVQAFARHTTPSDLLLAEALEKLERVEAALREAAERVQRRVGAWDSLAGHEPRDRFAAFGEALRHDAMALVGAALTTGAEHDA